MGKKKRIGIILVGIFLMLSATAFFRVAIINRGKIVVVDAPEKLKSTSRETQSVVTFDKPVEIRGPSLGEEPMIKAVQTNDVASVRNLIVSGATVNTTDKNGTTALVWAARGGNTEIVKLMINAGADVNAKTNFGTTALMMAAMAGRAEVVKILVNPRIGVDLQTKPTTDVNAKDKRENTALLFALRGKQYQIVKILQDAGAK